MAVFKEADKKRAKPWCVKVPKHPKKFFATQAEAKEHEAKLRLVPASRMALAKVTIGDLVERYRDEVTPSKKGKVEETSRLNQIIHLEPGKALCAVKLSALQSADAWTYINARLKQKSKRGSGLVTPRTVSRERNVLQEVLQTAKTKWGYTGLENIFRGLKIKGSKYKRTRRLDTDEDNFAGDEDADAASAALHGEYMRLMEACQGCRTPENRIYLPLAIDITLETGMRSQEVYGLTWGDISFVKRMINIRKSKTDDGQEIPGRIIVLPWSTMVRLAGLAADKDGKQRKVKPTDRVFPMTQDALEQAFDRAVKRAGITGLQFRDLRREANSRWGEREPALTDTQRKAMMGHLGTSVDTNDVYSVAKLKKIRQKLDRQYHGAPFEEKYANLLEKGESYFTIAVMISRGVLPMPWEEREDGDWTEPDVD